ncbi:MAG: hypothetical protein U1D35_00985, partial [Paracoccaceae bacterium]|nr:hypothetical protein [Paracoccaceae bacterium]
KDMMKLLVAEFEKVADAAAKTQGGKIATEFAQGLEDKVLAKTTALSDAAVEKITGKAKKKDDGDEEEDDEEDSGDPGLRALLSDRSEAAKLIAAKFDNVALMKQREEAAKKMSEDMQAMIEDEGAEFRLALVTGFNMASDDEEEVDIGESNRLASIDYILAVQRKNDATFALCKSIATIGVGLVTKLFPGASLVGACLTLAFTIQDAIAKTEELIIWTANFKDAQAASSAQVDAFLNRKGLQTEQTARAAIQVALDAAKVVAEVLKLTPAAPAGPVVQASAVAAEATIELTAILYTEVQMARAWKIYEKARDDPQDRYLARKATQANPTLAKYAMAWGATKGDPIAVEGMRRCGLNEHTLAMPETNVAKVVEYLEAKYADDPVLLRAVPVKQKWHPGPVVLSLSSWASFYQMATTEAVPAVTKTNDIIGINAALGALDGAEARFSTEIERLFDVNKAQEGRS